MVSPQPEDPSDFPQEDLNEKGSTPMATRQFITTPFGIESTAAEVIDGVDLTGRRAIVTGGASGIGVETARALAEAGAEVTIAARDTGAAPRRRGRQMDDRPRRPRRAARPDRPRVDRRVHRPTGTARSTSSSTTRASWRSRTARPRGLGDAVRDEPPRPFRAHHRPARCARAAPATRASCRSARAATCARRSCGTTCTSRSGPTSRCSPTASRRRRTCCSRSRPPGAGPTTGSRANALMPGGIATNLQRHVGDGDYIEQRAGRRRSCFKTAEQGAATSVLLAASPCSTA